MVKNKWHQENEELNQIKSAEVIGAQWSRPTHLSTVSNQALYLMFPLIPLDWGDPAALKHCPPKPHPATSDWSKALRILRLRHQRY